MTVAEEECIAHLFLCFYCFIIQLYVLYFLFFCLLQLIYLCLQHRKTTIQQPLIE